MEIHRTVQASVLISEVKKHPILYDYQVGLGQNNTRRKREAWKKIAANICGQRWDTFDCFEKDNIAKELQIKWKNLRDNFARKLKKEQADALAGHSTKIRPSRYNDQMSFMKPYIIRKQTRNLNFNEDEDNIKEELDCDSEEGGSSSNIIFVNKPEETNDEPSYQPSITSIGGLGTLTPVQLVQINPNPAETITHAPRACADQGCGEALRILAEIQQEERSDDRMENKKFLLSLLPFMQKLTDDVNLEVRMQLMSVVHSYFEKS